MTWTSVENRSGGVVHVAADSHTNLYNGGTAPSTSLPVLCLRVANAPVPAGIDFLHRLGKGLSRAVVVGPGLVVHQPRRGGLAMRVAFGPTWRMAEFHDGNYGQNLAYSGGWSYRAYRTMPVGTRFWVAINDQPANPWN